MSHFLLRSEDSYILLVIKSINHFPFEYCLLNPQSRTFYQFFISSVTLSLCVSLGKLGLSCSSLIPFSAVFNHFCPMTGFFNSLIIYFETLEVYLEHKTFSLVLCKLLSHDLIILTCINFVSIVLVSQKVGVIFLLVL